jgi:uncharacterized protein
MKKILYLHGLESLPVGDKNEFMKEFGILHAPIVKYKEDKDFFSKLSNVIKDNNIDLVIGSSLGGYTAYHLGIMHEIPSITFNPALSLVETILGYSPLPNITDTQKSERFILLGELDDVVHNHVVTDYLKLNNDDKAKVTYIPNMGHRVPYEKFQMIGEIIQNKI